MNKHIKSLYPWARNYDKGGPIKRQNLLAGMKTPEQVAAETMSVAENTKTQNSIDATEQRLQANKAQKERMQQQLSRQNAEIKPQNENPLHYASTNPLTQQIANLGYTNEQNPQTWYRPGYDYQQQYFSPETRKQAKNDMSNFTSLLFGAAFPEMLPFLAAHGSNELFNANEQSKQDVNEVINIAGFFTGGTHSVRDLFNRGKNIARNTVEQVKFAKNFKPRQIAKEGDFVFEPFRGQDENLIGSVFYNKRDLQHKSGSKYGQKNILGRSLEKVLRGGIKSDVYVEKSLMDQANLTDVKLNPLKKINRGFKSTFGKDANPKDYYRISTEQLLTSKMPINTTGQSVYDDISNQIVSQLKTKAPKQTVPVFYNPKTSKSPGAILRWGLYGLPTAVALETAFNTTSSYIGQWQDYKDMRDRLQDTNYADFQALYYDLPQQDRDNISLIVSNYINNPYELENKQQFDTLVNAFEQQYGEKGLQMLNAYVKYQTPDYSNPAQIHLIDATKSFVNDHVYPFETNKDEDNAYAEGGPKKIYTAEQLAAMINARHNAELSGMSPMSKDYNGPKIVQTDKTKTPSKIPPKVEPKTEEELKDDPAAYVKEKSNAQGSPKKSAEKKYDFSQIQTPKINFNNTKYATTLQNRIAQSDANYKTALKNKLLDFGQLAYDGIALRDPTNIMDASEAVYNGIQLGKNNPYYLANTSDVANTIENVAGSVRNIPFIDKAGDVIELLQDLYELDDYSQYNAASKERYKSRQLYKDVQNYYEWYKLTTPQYQQMIDRMHGEDPIQKYIQLKEHEEHDQLRAGTNSFAEGGPKKDKFYNTQLTPEQEQQYQQWVQTLPINLRSDYDYDLRGAWLNGDLPDQNYHMTDKWKKPWHPTFSNESIYSTPQMTGGRWDEDTFIPSTTNKFIDNFHYGQWGANSFAKGGYKAYSKSADKLNEEYGIDMSMPKKAFRQNRKNAWAGLEQSQRVAEQLASQTPYQMTPSERVENYIEGNNIPVDAGNYVYNYRQAKQRDAYKDYVSYMSQLANPTAASFANRVAERSGYRGLAVLGTALALSPLAFLAAGNAGTIYKVLTHPVTDIALTAHGAVTAPSNIKSGIENIRNGSTGEGIVDLGLTTLDITGAGQLLGRTGRMLNRAYRAKHAYNTIAPVGYEGVLNRGKQWIKDLWYNPEVDLHNPKWFQEASARDKTNTEDFESRILGVLRTGNYLPLDVINGGKIADRARMDAWAIYNGLPQPYNTYIKNLDGTYSYDMKKIMDLSHGTWHPARAPKKGVPKQDVVYDFVTGAGGGLTDFKLIAEGDYGNGIMRLEDTWDLHPFSRDETYFADKLRNLLIDKIGSENRRNTVQKLRKKLFDKGIFGIYGTPIQRIMYPIDKMLNHYSMGLFSPKFEIKSGKYGKQVVLGFADKLIWDLTESVPIRKFSDKLRNFEVGTISGGKPFKMRTDIPFYNKAADPDYITQMNNILQIQDPVKRMQAKWLIGNTSPYAYGFNPKYFRDVKPILASDNVVIDTKKFIQKFDKGGSIHINPKIKDHYSTILVKRANFARVFGKKK